MTGKIVRFLKRVVPDISDFSYLLPVAGLPCSPATGVRQTELSDDWWSLKDLEAEVEAYLKGWRGVV